MKKLLTHNFGLKIVSVITAIVLWIVIVNIDDPVISRTYTGIQVEMINEKTIDDEGKTYEVLDGTDLINVSITAKRSVIENMSKDYIKATADLKQLTFMDTVPIELRSTRYNDQIQSINSRSNNVQVEIENKIQKRIKVRVVTEGEVSEGYVVGTVTPNVSVVTVTGPESIVNEVMEAVLTINVDGMNESFTYSAEVELKDKDSDVIADEMVSASMKDILTEVEVLETKEIPITAGTTGTPATGHTATGTVICEPSSIKVAGLGRVFDSLSSVTIPDGDIVIENATENVTKKINISKYLPNGIKLVDSEDESVIEVTAVVEANEILKTKLLVSDISVENVPKGYKAEVIHNGVDNFDVNVSGLSDTLSKLQGYPITAVIDGSTLKPVLTDGETSSKDGLTPGTPKTGVNEGTVILVLPDGVTQVENVPVQVFVSEDDQTGEDSQDENAGNNVDNNDENKQESPTENSEVPENHNITEQSPQSDSNSDSSETKNWGQTQEENSNPGVQENINAVEDATELFGTNSFTSNVEDEKIKALFNTISFYKKEK